ncbi:hypothetical protein X971_5161 (plasmid) [Agrobacterium tumefaciens LBA4213 (Ach5)]|nr:hypothetical protein X971_5161 [Agrobacterium tumefaciens LBA4213 (Ach5)]
MKPIALDALIMERAGEGETSDDIAVRSMEGRIEGRRLDEIGPKVLNCTDKAEALGLMERCQWNEFLDRGRHGFIDQHRPVKDIPSMDDTMSDGRYNRQIEMVGEPPEDLIHHLTQVFGGMCIKSNIEYAKPFREMKRQRMLVEIDDAFAYTGWT